MSISPYIHQYKNHAAYLEPYNMIPYTSNRQILTEDILKQIKIPNLQAISSQMQKVSGKNNFNEANIFFKKLGKELQDILEIKNSQYSFDKGKLFWSAKGGSLKNADFNKYVDTLDQIIQKTENFVNYLDNFKRSKEFNDLITASAISVDANTTIYDPIRKRRDQIYNIAENFGAIEVGTAASTKQLGAVQNQKEHLKKFLNSLQMTGVVPKDNVIEHAIDSMLFFAGLLSGAVEEFQVEGILNENIDKIKKVLSSEYVTIENTGKNKQSSDDKKYASVSKGDVAINIKDDSGNIILSIPLSIKATGSSSLSNKSVNVNSRSTLRKILTNTSVGLHSFATQGILNAILYGYGGVSIRGGIKSASYGNKKDKQRILDAISKSNAVLALAGKTEFKKNGYAYYFVVNRKVYNMYDLLNLILTSEEGSNPLITEIKKNPDEDNMSLTAIAKDRANSAPGADNQRAASDLARERILNLHHNLKLKLNLINSAAV